MLPRADPIVGACKKGGRPMTFMHLPAEHWAAKNFLCVGLDPVIEKIPRHISTRCYHLPERAVSDFIRMVVNATSPFARAYKPNTAFFEAFGATGPHILRDIIAHIHVTAPGIPVILDAKRADIGSTNEPIAHFAFDYLGADAITVNPYLGYEALGPFLRRKDKGIIVLCRTSNPGAGEFQDRLVTVTDEEAERWDLERGTQMPLYQLTAYRVSKEWNQNGNCALVVGATNPTELKAVRSIVGDEIPILIPGIGAQGGDLMEAVHNGMNSMGSGFLINASRSITYASDGEDFAEAAGMEAKMLRDQINEHRRHQNHRLWP